MGAFLPPAFPKTGNIPPGMTAGRDIFMATYTSNYQLHQWVPGDNFLRTDFNTDFQKIDAALGSIRAQASSSASAVSGVQSSLSSVQSALSRKAEFVLGTYTGTGSGSGKTVSLGFQPRAVLISGGTYCGMGDRNNYTPLLQITASGFLVTYAASYGITPNTSGQGYAYLALK